MAVVVPDKKLIVVPMPSEDNYKILDEIFVTRTLSYHDGDVLILPHCEDVLRLLSNMGINTDGCDMFEWYYQPPQTKDGKTPWWWQLETASFLSKNPLSFCTSTPRTGKTLSTLMAADYVMQQYGGQALIVAPLTVANEGEWADTVKEWFPRRRVKLIHKDRANDIKEPADIYLINPAGVKIVKQELMEKAIRGDFRCLAIDELTEYANVSSQQWGALNEVARYIPFRWGLTGTPGGPEKVYGEVKIINPNNVPRSFYRWREMTMVKINQFKWIPKTGHEETIKEAMSPCIRFDKEQLMTIPTPQVVTEHVELTEEQTKLTQLLVEDLYAMVDGGDINVTTASTIAQKLLQVAGGVVKTTDGDEVRVDAQHKLDKLIEILGRTPRKKVVFSSFVGVNNMLVEHIRNAGYTCEKIDGSVTGGTRSKILKDFMNAPEPHVLVCHPRTTAYGVELASADYIICYGPPMTGAFMYQQLFERLSSAKQTADETFVVHLSAGKQDKLSFAALSSGVNIERNIVKIFTKDLADWDS